jgi:hypothetical protein
MAIHSSYLSRSTKSVIFELLETAAPVSDVFKAENALTWDFPSWAVAVPLSEFAARAIPSAEY